MTREEKIAAIYKEMANKELTFGCKLQVIESVGPIQGVIFNIVSESYKVLWDDRRISTETKKNDFSVIGHPVMIGDVLDWIGDKRFYCGECRKLVDGRDVSDDGLGREYYCDICNNDYIENTRDYIVLDRDKKRDPIEAQSDECIDYVYSLIQKD